jgi:hypothetical protein
LHQFDLALVVGLGLLDRGLCADLCRLRLQECRERDQWEVEPVIVVVEVENLREASSGGQVFEPRTIWFMLQYREDRRVA